MPFKLFPILFEWSARITGTLVPSKVRCTLFTLFDTRVSITQPEMNDRDDLKYTRIPFKEPPWGKQIQFELSGGLKELG